MNAWAITVTILVEGDEREDAMSTLQELLNDGVFDRPDDRFGAVVDVYSGTHWSIVPAVEGGTS